MPATSSVAPETLTLDVVATRGGEIESRHRVHAAVVRGDGTLLARAHDPALRTWWRSCAKPFQLLPMLEDGSFDRSRMG
jgi:L-asparaginase II